VSRHSAIASETPGIGASAGENVSVRAYGAAAHNGLYFDGIMLRAFPKNVHFPPSSYSRSLNPNN